MCSISIIIPTTCNQSREQCLLRAIDSALNQTNVDVEVLVVVNGERLDRNLFNKLKLDSRLSVFYLPEGNVSKARYHGIVQSNNNYFGFLDDDDELLPDSLRDRFDVLNADDSACVGVSNGYFFDIEDHLHVDGSFYQEILNSTAFSFLKKNWFASPAALYKKSHIDIKLFNINYSYFELSYIFFKLLESHYKIAFFNIVAYRCYEDTVASASKSEAYRIAYPDMLKLILRMDLPQVIKVKLKRKYIVGLNSLSVYFLDNKKFKAAFLYHAKCLINGGFDYFPYTRRILFLYVYDLFLARKTSK